MPNPVIGTKIADLADAAPLVGADNLVIERGGNSNYRTTLDEIRVHSVNLAGHNVAELDDVSDAGSGIIISGAERTAIGTNTTNIGTNTTNIGNNVTTLAEKIEGLAGASVANDIMVWDGITGKLAKSGGGSLTPAGALSTVSVDATAGMTAREGARYTNQTALGITGAVSWNLDSDPSVVITSPTGAITLTVSGGLVNSKGELRFLQHGSTAQTLSVVGGGGATAYWAEADIPDLTQLLTGADGIWKIYAEYISATIIMLSYQKLSAIV